MGEGKKKKGGTVGIGLLIVPLVNNRLKEKEKFQDTSALNIKKEKKGERMIIKPCLATACSRYKGEKKRKGRHKVLNSLRLT